MISILTEKLQSNEELDPQSTHIHCEGWTGLMGHRSDINSQTTSFELNMSGSWPCITHSRDSRVLGRADKVF